MHYKSIVLELIQQRPQLHELLRSSRTMRATIDAWAMTLKACHEQWKTQLAEDRPHSDPIQIASAALEIALHEFQESLPPLSPSSDSPLTLDGAMAFVRRHFPPA